MAQKFKFPMEFMRVTQKENVGSHIGSLAMDFGGKDTGADRLYCPCDMVVKRCRKNANGELYLESTQPVQFADGSVDYARLICIHDGTFNVVEGQIIRQGEYFYDEGGMGSNNPKAFATHVHIEGGKGKWNSTTQFPNSHGTYVIENQSHLYDMFVLGEDVVIMTDPETGKTLDGGYPWKRETAWNKTDKYLSVTSDRCEFFNSTDIYDTVGKLPQGTVYEAVEISTGLIGGFTWVKFKMTDGEYYAVLLSDRSELIEKPVVCHNCEKLKAENEKLKRKVQELERDVEGAAPYAEENAVLKAEIAQLQEKLAVAQETAEIARSQMEHDDFYIQQLKGEISRHISERDKLAAQVVSLSSENGVLKETIISLQEQSKPPEKKCLFEKILDILFGGE